MSSQNESGAKRPLWMATVEKFNLKSGTKARDLIKAGKIAVNGKAIRKPGDLISSLDKLDLIELAVPETAKRRKTFPFPVLADDAFWFVFVKPAGIPVLSADHGLVTAYKLYMDFKASTDESTLDHHVMNKPDRRESGIVVITKGLRNRKLLSETFEAATFKYYALAEGIFSEGETRIEHKVAINKIGYLVPTRDAKAPELVLRCRLMKRSDDYSLVKVEADSKLKNQIRAGLSISGFPIAGDKRYGAHTNPLSCTCLHLFSIEVTRPDKGEKVLLRTAVPREYINLAKPHNRKLDLQPKSKKKP